jgi:hypothetical protein
MAKEYSLIQHCTTSKQARPRLTETAPVHLLVLILSALVLACPSAQTEHLQPVTAAAASGAVAPPLGPASAPAAAAGEPAPIRCQGVCRAELLQLQKGAALATWVDEHVTWGQFIDTALGKPTGAPIALGHLSGDEPQDRPQVVALPDGDVAYVGVLPNGRVSFARGSEAPARRVAPKVVLPSEEHAVRELALAAHGGGVGLLVLREMGYMVSTEAVQLQLLDARGEPLGPGREWTTPPASSPRMAECGGTLFLAWEAGRDVLVTRVPTTAEGALAAPPFGTQTFVALPQVAARLESLTCEGADARLLAGWHSMSGKAAARASISSALLTATASGKRGKWSTVRLPGPVLGRDGFAAIDPESGHAHVAIERAGKVESIRVDLAGAQLVPTSEPRSLSSSAVCVPSAADRFVCVDVQSKTVSEECYLKESTLEYTFPGFAAAGAPAPGGAGREYFAPTVAGIPESERAARHFCGDPGWDALQVALANWCRDPAGAGVRFGPGADEDEEALGGTFDGYCGSAPDSQLSQVMQCTDQPPSCKPQADRRLAVDRKGLEFGSEELWLIGPGNCSVRFSGKPGAWRVAEAACQTME